MSMWLLLYSVEDYLNLYLKDQNLWLGGKHYMILFPPCKINFYNKI